jgi:photosystem II stability/assembly factor-like uncharacterized protein
MKWRIGKFGQRAFSLVILILLKELSMRVQQLFASVLVLFFANSVLAQAQTPDIAEATKPKSAFSAATFSGIKLREIGPAVASGRIIDIAVVAHKPATWYVAVASGGVWKTTNAGTTWTPIFDSEGSYSIGCVTVDPTNENVIWVGSGENNSQRSVGYGDGVYKSLDGGKTWKNMGLKASEHIGKIIVDPRNADIVYVSAQGPLWASGGDRGLYKTVDGGKNWNAVLTVSENTGVSDLWMDPRDSKVLYASSYQRRRHQWTLLNGGPESAIWKSTDAGITWRKLDKGIPKVDLGRIGLAVSPVNSDVLYAIVEATDVKDKGIYRSNDRGESWSKQSDYVSGSPQYYQELIPDPKNVDRVYSMDVFSMVTEDGGKTWKRVGEKHKHIDNHALWIDPADTDHLVNGNDGGVYESWDRGVTWHFKANLPVTQFYRVAVDNALPFYNIYGGTQDNNTLGGPSRTMNANGIVNSDWFVTVGGDGFFAAIDPTDSNIVYSSWQYGGLIRFDRKTGERVDIKPRVQPGEAPLRWNWDSPLIISPHNPKRLYFAAQRVFRSDDRGDNWVPVSPDLSQQIDRNKLKIMGRVWSVDAVAKNHSTSLYGSVISLSESPIVEGLLYAGTDDGLVQISEDGGKNGRLSGALIGIPANAAVSDLKASAHDASTVYAAFNNHKMGDFKPYLLKSADRGKTWVSIVGDLPVRGTVHTMAEDPTRPSLLYVGTEFGLYFSPDAGRRWIQLKGGMPTIAVRDITVQKREGDLVVGTFGRGFFVLDDLTPLRNASDELLAKEAALMPVKKAWMYIPRTPLGGRDKASQGAAFYTAPNPLFGAVFTYYLKDELITKRQARLNAEKKIQAKGGDTFYPTWEALERETREPAPAVMLTITDSAGNVVRRVSAPTKAGFHRVAWDLRYPATNPARTTPIDAEANPWDEGPRGVLALPGNYTATLEKWVDGKVTQLAASVTVNTEMLGTASLPAPDRAKVLEFSNKVASLQRAVLGVAELSKEVQRRLDALKVSLIDTRAAALPLLTRARAISDDLKDLDIALTGNKILDKYQEPLPTPVSERVSNIVSSLWVSTSAPTGTQERGYEIAASEFAPLLEKMRTILEVDLVGLEAQAEALSAPWTPGRLPVWKKN